MTRNRKGSMPEITRKLYKVLKNTIGSSLLHFVKSFMDMDFKMDGKVFLVLILGTSWM